MGSLRRDAAVAAAAVVLEAERAAVAAGGGAVATIGELTLEPGAINVISGLARLSVDIRAPDQDLIDRTVSEIKRVSGEIATARGLTLTYRERQRVAPVALDARVV